MRWGFSAHEPKDKKAQGAVRLHGSGVGESSNLQRLVFIGNAARRFSYSVVANAHEEEVAADACSSP